MEISFQGFCRTLNLPSPIVDYFSKHWDGLITGVSEEIPYYLTEEYFKTYYPYTHSPFSYEEISPLVQTIIELCRENPALNVLGQLIYSSAYHLPEAETFGAWPDSLPILGEKYTGMFYFMLSLGAFPLIEKTHRRLGIPPSYALDILSWLGGTMLGYGEAHQQRPGRPGTFGWIRHYVEGMLFRIGRLEYLLHPYPEWMPAVFEDSEGNLAVLSRDNWHYADYGLRTEEPKKAIFTTKLKEENNAINGTPIAPNGTIAPNTIRRLDTAKWRPVAAPWDLCPSMHIPSGQRMPFEEIQLSMKQAIGFFSEFLHRKIHFFCCCSWILNPLWEELLTNSNIVRFRQEGYAIPCPDWGKRNGINFIFGRDDINPTELPAHNRLQCAVQEGARRNRLDVGVIFFMAADIDKLGNQYYRRHYR